MDLFASLLLTENAAIILGCNWRTVIEPFPYSPYYTHYTIFIYLFHLLLNVMLYCNIGSYTIRSTDLHVRIYVIYLVVWAMFFRIKDQSSKAVRTTSAASYFCAQCFFPSQTHRASRAVRTSGQSLHKSQQSLYFPAIS